MVDLKTKLADSQSNEEHQKSEAVKWRDQAQAAKKEHRAVSDALEQARAELKAGAEPSITPSALHAFTSGSPSLALSVLTTSCCLRFCSEIGSERSVIG